MSSANIINQGGSAFANRLLTRGEGGSKNPDFMLTLYVHLPLGQMGDESLQLKGTVFEVTKFDLV